MVDRLNTSASVFGAIIVALALVTVFYVWRSTEQFEDFVECQAAWGDRLVAAQVAIDEAAAEDRRLDRRETHAVTVLITDLIEDKVSNDEAIATWRETIAEISRDRTETAEQREANPLPSPPTEVCDQS